MEYLLNSTCWLIGGALLILLEFFVPGLVVVFLGLGALATGGLIYLNVIRDALQVIVFFVLASILMLATLRRIIVRFYPSASESVETDEDKLIMGAAAHTISEISPDNFSGRIKFRGTTWSAKSLEGPIAIDQPVVIAGRENISLLVKHLP